jgi:hypothetical protein
MAARNGDAKLVALEKALASPATLPDLQAKLGQLKKLGLTEIAARFAAMAWATV